MGRERLGHAVGRLTRCGSHRPEGQGTDAGGGRGGRGAALLQACAGGAGLWLPGNQFLQAVLLCKPPVEIGFYRRFS